MLPQASFERRMFPLAFIQFASSFCDYALKILVVMMIPWAAGAYLRDALFMFMLTLSCLIPAAALYMPSGMFSDLVPKRYVIMLGWILSTFLLGFGVFSIAWIDVWGVWPALSCVFALSFVSAFVTPGVNAILPETFSEKELSRAVGKIDGLGFWGALSGIVLSVAAHHVVSPLACSILIVCVSVLGFVFSVRVVPVISAVQKRKELAYSFGQASRIGWREVFRTPSMLLSVLGDSTFMGLGTALLLLLMLFSKYTLKDDGEATEIALLQASPVIGIGLGCYLAGRLSVNKIELGLVPLGALGVALMLPLAAYFPGEASYMVLEIPGLLSKFEFHMHISAQVWLLLAGLSGGLFIVPLRAFFLQRVRPERRGASQAASKLLSYGVMLVINLTVFILALGTAKDIDGLPSFLRTFGSHMPSLSPQTLIVGLGAFTFLVTLFSMWALPDFALRFIIITLGNTCYRNRISGAENIPERGPALLLANHASYIDSILISASTSRRIRFLMNEDFFKVPFLSLIARLTGFIRVPSVGKHKSMAHMLEQVRQILRDGDIVCVFPEGRITRNGIIGRFKSGYQKMLPADVDVPLIPVNVGSAWGSVFSYYKGDIRFRFPKSFPYFTSVSFGRPVSRDMTPFEVRQTVCELSAEAALENPLPDEKVIHYELARLAKRHPFHTYMRDADGKRYSYFKTFLAAIIFSREIRRMTSSECKYVGVLLPNSTAGALSMLGVLMADKVPCPLNFTTSQEIFEMSVKKARITCILTSRRFLSRIKITETPEMVFLEDLVKTIPAWKKLVAALGIIFIPWKEFINMLSPLSCKDIMATGALLFSSGSTGIPKGVMLSHHNIYSDIYAMKQAVAFEPGNDKIIGLLPLFHSFGMNTCFWLPLMLRSEVVFVNSPLDAGTVGKTIENYGITLLFATPSFLQTYMRKCTAEQFRTLRLVVTGAEKLRSDISERFHEMMQGRLKIVEGYGCTELAPVATINLAEKLTDLGAQYGKTGAIGLPLETICARIVDPLTFKPVLPDAEGLFFVKGPMVMQGYLDEPEKTREAIVDGYYNTGDIAKMDERGYITICGRLSRFSKIAGEMVPHELVECIINEMLGLEQRVVAVASIPDLQKGEALLVLYVPEMPMAPEKVVELLRERSISNLWIPKASNFYCVERLPLLGSGKLDLSALRQMSEKVALERNLPTGAAPEPRKSPDIDSIHES